MTEPAEIAEKILSCLSSEPVTVHQIVCRTRLHNKTVKKYLELIERIQDAPKIKKEVRGIRVFFRKEG